MITQEVTIGYEYLYEILEDKMAEVLGSRYLLGLDNSLDI